MLNGTLQKCICSGTPTLTDNKILSENIKIGLNNNEVTTLSLIIKAIVKLNNNQIQKQSS